MIKKHQRYQKERYSIDERIWVETHCFFLIRNSYHGVGLVTDGRAPEEISIFAWRLPSSGSVFSFFPLRVSQHPLKIAIYQNLLQQINRKCTADSILNFSWVTFHRTNILEKGYLTCFCMCIQALLFNSLCLLYGKITKDCFKTWGMALCAFHWDGSRRQSQGLEEKPPLFQSQATRWCDFCIQWNSS